MKITKQQLDHLDLLKEASKLLNEQINENYRIAVAITQEDGEGDWTFDFIHNTNWTAKELCEKLGIEIENENN